MAYKYICLSCGKPNNYFKTTCEACEDHNGGDGEDD